MSLFLAASGSKLCEMSDQGLALTHWALAVTRVTPTLSWRAEAVRVVTGRLAQLDTRQLTMVVWAWGRMQVHLTPQQPQQPSVLPVPAAPPQEAPQPPDGPELTWQQQQQPEQQVGSQQQTAAAAVEGAQLALSTHRLQRRRVAQQLLAAALSLHGQFSAVELTHLLAGLAKMQLYPSQAWLSAVVQAGVVGGRQQQQQRSVPGLDGYQMQQLLWALAMLRYRAPVAWVDSMGVLLETKWQGNPNTRASAEWALRQLRMLAADAPTTRECARQ